MSILCAPPEVCAAFTDVMSLAAAPERTTSTPPASAATATVRIAHSAEGDSMGGHGLPNHEGYSNGQGGQTEVGSG